MVCIAAGAFWHKGAPAAVQLPTLTEVIETRSIDSLTLSPDGSHLGYRIVSRSVAADTTSAQWYMVGTRGGSPIPLGKPVEPFFEPVFDFVKDGVSAWNANARSLYILSHGSEGHQVHQLSASGSDRLVTHDPADILSFEISAARDRIDYETRDDRSTIATAQAKEERDGIRMDRTIFPEGWRLTRNFHDGNHWATIRRAGPPLGADFGIEAYAGAIRSKTVSLESVETIAAPAPPGRHDAIVTSRAKDLGRELGARDGSFAVQLNAAPLDADYKHKMAIGARMSDGALRICDAFFCRGNELAIRQVMINDERGEIVIAYEANYSARVGLYGWDPSTGAVRTIREPSGSLDGGYLDGSTGCPQWGAEIYCVEAGPDLPPHLVRVSLETGASSIMLDPNIALRERYFGAPRFLEWSDASGRRWSGVLLQPPGKLRRRPLVISTYRCRGFLRGGTSQLAPEYPLVAKGFAVLCGNLNNDISESGSAPAAPIKAAIAGYGVIVKQLADQGLVDPSRVGIAGHSFTANMIAYAISHGQHFAAAVTGAGTNLDPMSYVVTAPNKDSWRKDVVDFLRLPQPMNDPEGIWRQVSPAANVNAIGTPLLLQPPELEWDFAMQLFNAMEDAGKPVDMYIYPDEGHNSSRHPAHISARGQKSIDWFDVWLNPARATDSNEPSYLQRWRRLRAGQPSG